MPIALDLRDQLFGWLVAVKPTDKRSRRLVIWECVCQCGAVCHVTSYRLKHGVTRSCGCYARAVASVTGKKIPYGKRVSRIHMKGARPNHYRAGGTLKAKAFVERLKKGETC